MCWPQVLRSLERCRIARIVRDLTSSAGSDGSRRPKSKGAFMLAALLLAGIVAAPLGSAGLFVRANQRAGAAGAWSTIRRFVLDVAGTAVLAAVVAGVLRLLHATEHNLVAAVAALVVASLVWLPVTRRWNARAHLCWASSVFLFAVYLVFSLTWTLDSHLGLASTVGGVLLWALEVFAGFLSCAYLWEICDALGTEDW